MDECDSPPTPTPPARQTQTHRLSVAVESHKRKSNKTSAKNEKKKSSACSTQLRMMFVVVTIFADTTIDRCHRGIALFPTDELLHQAHDLLRKMMGTTAMEKNTIAVCHLFFRTIRHRFCGFYS